MSDPTTHDDILVLTEPAAEQVRLLSQSDPANEGKCLRVAVDSGGCSGRQYGMRFDHPGEGDHVSKFYGVTVLVDPNSAAYLRGTVIDFKDDLNESGFKISNPNAQQSCGCGKSFEA